MEEIRYCVVCKKSYIAKKANAKYCSQECRENPQYQYDEYKKRQASGKKVCRHCGKKFVGPNYFYCKSCHAGISKSAAHG